VDDAHITCSLCFFFMVDVDRVAASYGYGFLSRTSLGLLNRDVDGL